MCALAAYVPPDPWTDLTPAGTYPGGTTNYPYTFGIAVRTAAPVAKREDDAVKQIDDGQVQAHTEAPAQQIDDGQVQNRPAEEAAKQIDDGQVQNRPAEAPAQQIDDGQVQNRPAEDAAQQIDDGQVQNRPEEAAQQIADGQVQDRPADAADQIADGQVQDRPADAAGQTDDGQVEEPASAPAADAAVGSYSCRANGVLEMHLEDGILYDSHGRIGSIVANHQFQFDGPPPQAGAIYARGWSVTPTGFLALGDSDLFYQCLSGDFYNLYDESIGEQCHPVHLRVVNIVDC